MILLISSPDCYYTTMTGSKKLRNDAVPTIHFPSVDVGETVPKKQKTLDGVHFRTVQQSTSLMEQQVGPQFIVIFRVISGI